MKTQIIRKITLVAVVFWLLPFTLPAQTVNVWPGDVNNDGVVNGLDLIYLGRAYGLTGPVRTDTTNSVWAVQAATPWTGYLSDTMHTNAAYADCNGDGVVDSLDQYLVEQNYGLTHTGVTVDTIFSLGTDTNPALYFASLQDTFVSGSQAELYLTIGTPSIPVDSFFGLTFSINYDTTLVQKNTVTAELNSRLLSGDDVLYMAVNFPDSGRLDVAIALKGTSNGAPVYALSGYGNISTVNYILENNIIGKTETVLTLPVTASRVRLVDRDLNVLPVNVLTDTIYIAPDPLGIAGINNGTSGTNILVYPNPAKGNLNIDAGNEIIREVSIYDMVGREVLSALQNKAGTSTINLNTIVSGLYMVRITTDLSVVTKKIQVE